MINFTSPTTKGLFAVPFRQIKRTMASGFARRVVTVFSIKILGVTIAFAVTALLTRLMGTEQYGIHVTVVSWLAILVMPSVFGMDTVALRFLSSYTASKAYAKTLGLIRFSRRFILAMSSLCLVVALGVVGGLFLADRIASDEALCFAIGFLVIPILAQLTLNSKLLWACGNSTIDSALVNFVRPGSFALLLFLSYLLLPSTLTARESLAAFALATLLTTLIGMKVVRSHLRENKSIAEVPEYEKKVWLKAAMPLLFSSSFQIVMGQCSIVMVEYYLGYTEAGFYSIANRLVQLAIFGLAATSMIVAPMIASAYANGRTEDLKRSLRHGATAIFGLTIPLVAFLLLAGKWLLSIFGEDFTAAYPALFILGMGQTFNAFCGCTGYLMLMTGNERASAVISFGVALLNIGLNTMLIPHWGIQGAASATSISLVVWNVAMLVVIRKRVKVNPTILSWLSK